MESNIEPEYMRLVDLVCEKDMDFDFSNSSIEHARYIIKKFIDNTKKELNIFIPEIDKDIFLNPEIQETIKNKNCIIKVIVEKANKNIIKELKEKLSIEIKSYSNDNLKEAPYFFVSDSKRIRISSKQNINKAQINFNNGRIGKHLNDIFSLSWEKASHNN